MTESTVDKEAACRFISSLSKSLQALCHGCMDFDSGIEIMGYININIDNGSKVDYVLNEKVLKSRLNSMTCISNSFLVKKDEPKNQTQDGSCSPVPELQPQSYDNYSPVYPQQYGSDLSVTPRSKLVLAFRKRPWNVTPTDLRPSPQKQSRISTDSHFHQQNSPQSALHSESSSYNSFNTSEVESSLHQSNVPVSNDNSESINIKQELFQHEDNDNNAQTEFNNCHNSCELSDTCTNIHVKCEPGTNVEENCLDTQVSDFNTELRNSLIQSRSSIENTESFGQSQSSFKSDSKYSSFEGLYANVDTSLSGTSNVPQYMTLSAQDMSVAQGTHNESYQDMSYPGTSYSEERVVSKDESTEIGDEDEAQLNQRVDTYFTRRGPVINGFQFYLVKHQKNSTIWRCSRQGCTARCTTHKQDITVVKSGNLNHNHAPDPAMSPDDSLFHQLHLWQHKFHMSLKK